MSDRAETEVMGGDGKDIAPAPAPVIPARAGIQKGELPTDMVVVPLESIISIQKGKKPKDLGEKTSKRTTPYIDIKAFETGELRRYCNAENTVECQNDDVLMVWDGARSGLVGIGAKGAVGSTIARLSSEKVTPKYLYYFLQSKFTYLNTNTRGVGIPHIDPNVFKNLEIPIAPPEQQKQIVSNIEELFSHIDSGMASLKKAKELLKQYRQSVLKAAVTGELTREWREANKDKLEPAADLLARILKERRRKWEEQQLQKFKAKGRLPKDDAWKKKYKEPIMEAKPVAHHAPDRWAWASIEQLTWDVSYGTSSKTNDDERGVPILRMGNIVDGELDYTNMKYLPANHEEFPELLLEGGDLLFNRTNSAELVGKTAVYRDTGKPTSFASYLIRVKTLEGVEPDYIAFFLNSSLGKEWVKGCVSQNVGQANVNGSKLKALTIPLPSKVEQAEIARQVSERTGIQVRLSKNINHQLDNLSQVRLSVLRSAYHFNSPRKS